MMMTEWRHRLSAVLTPRRHYFLLRLWHAWLAGSFLVAWVTADEDRYAMHLFSGYLVLAAIGLRLAVGICARDGCWRLPRLSLARRAGRHPLFAWLAALLLGCVGLASASGALADGTPWLEHPHEALSNLALLAILGHLAFVLTMFGGGRRQSGISPLKETVR